MMKVIGEFSTAILVGISTMVGLLLYGEGMGVCSGSDCLGMLIAAPAYGTAAVLVYGIARISYLIAISRPK